MKRIYALAGQACSTLGNIVLTLFAAQLGSAREFGAWALVYATFVLLLTFSRVVASTTFLISREHRPREMADQGRGSISTAFAVGLLSPLFAVVTASLVGVGIEALVTLGVAAGIVVGQSGVRYFLVKMGFVRRAAMLDFTHFSLFLVAAGILFAVGEPTLTSVTAAWGLAALPGILLELWRWRILPTPRTATSYVLANRWEMKRLAADAGINSATTAAIPYALAAIAGLEAAGALRAGQTIFGGIGLIILGLTPLFTVESSKRLDEGQRAVTLLVMWSLLVGALSLPYALGAIAIPDRYGELLFGATWAAAALTVLPLAIQAVLRGPSAGAPALLQASLRLDDGVKFRVATLPTNLVPPLVGAWVDGGQGCAWGICISAVLVNIQAFWAVRDPRSAGKDSP